MVFIYNTTGFKLGLMSETVSINDTDEVKVINLKVGENSQRIMTVDNDVEESISLASLNKTFAEIRHNPFKTDLSARGKKCVYTTDDDTIEVTMKDFLVSDQEAKNRELPRAVVYVVTKSGGEVYMDSRSLYAPIVTFEHKDFSIHKLVMRYGKWASLKIRVFISIKDGDVMKKLQLRGMRLSSDKKNPKYNYITNTLQESDMTEEEYNAIKEGVAPKFGHRSIDKDPVEKPAPQPKSKKKKKKAYKNNFNANKSSDSYSNMNNSRGGYSSNSRGNNRSNNRANYNNRGR